MRCKEYGVELVSNVYNNGFYLLYCCSFICLLEGSSLYQLHSYRDPLGLIFNNLKKKTIGKMCIFFGIKTKHYNFY